MLTVNELVLDKLPAVNGRVKSIHVTEMLVKVEVTYYVFGLNPPVEFTVGLVLGYKSLVNHAAVRVQSFVRSHGDMPYYVLNFLQKGFITKHKRCLVDEP